jgi:hypothetical protein
VARACTREICTLAGLSAADADVSCLYVERAAEGASGASALASSR